MFRINPGHNRSSQTLSETQLTEYVRELSASLDNTRAELEQLRAEQQHKQEQQQSPTPPSSSSSSSSQSISK
jgi:hypothetical protein